MAGLRPAAGLAVLLLAAAAAGCGRKAAPAAPAPLQALTPLARIYYDNGGGIQDSVRLVVRDQATLASVWQKATSGQPTPPPAPTVDFTREMVLVAGAGRMTPEDQIQVDSVGMRRERTAEGKLEDVLTAWVRVTQGCRRFKADAYPVELVRVRRFAGSVHFVEQRVQATGCR
jgi:hypothetical protein